MGVADEVYSLLTSEGDDVLRCGQCISLYMAEQCDR